jgi:hypothetical protein
MLIYIGPLVQQWTILLSSFGNKIKFRFSSVNPPAPPQYLNFGEKNFQILKTTKLGEILFEKKEKKSLNLPYTCWIWLDPLLSHNNSK